MADYLDITTAIKNQDGTGYDGKLYATVTCALALAGGERIPAGTRTSWPVVAGVATDFKLPITEDANPSGVTVWLSLIDDNGRPQKLGAVVVPRAAGPVALASLLPL